MPRGDHSGQQTRENSTGHQDRSYRYEPEVGFSHHVAHVGLGTMDYHCRLQLSVPVVKRQPCRYSPSFAENTGYGFPAGLVERIPHRWRLLGYGLGRKRDVAIFFPLFTLLEDFGFLPRVAFNLDELFRRSGAHGKQALTMTMGFGCNAAAIINTRIIDSQRERLIAILTNNFSLCNGRWPTQILLATIFLTPAVPAYLRGVIGIGSVVAIALLGIAFMFFFSWVLSRTLLRGQVSTFNLELPPYRPPQFWQTIYKSIVDRTLVVLWRAVVFAAPAGALIWLTCNIQIGGVGIAEYLIDLLDGPGWLMGLNGVILLAYVLAIPANEIVIPTILMLTVLTTGIDGGTGAGVMFEADGTAETARLFEAGGWTMLTGINLMLFCLLHNPCSTTLFNIYKETGSRKWTLLAALIPLATGFVVTVAVAFVWRLVGG